MTDYILNRLLASLLLILIAAPKSFAQEKAPTPSPAAENEKAKTENKEAAVSSTTDPNPSATPQTTKSKLTRWLDLQSATLNLRYRFVDTSEGVTTTNQLQRREAFKGRFKFDQQGKYSISFGLFTGRRF